CQATSPAASVRQSGVPTEKRPAPRGKITDIVAKMSQIEAGDLNPSLKLGPDLGLSSLDRLELSLYLENYHQIATQDLILDEKTSVKDIENLLVGAGAIERKMPMPIFSNHFFFTILRLIFYHIILFPLIRIYCKQKVSGLEHLFDLNPPVIFIANHSSHMDTPVILKALPFRFRMGLSPAMKIDYFREYFMPDKENSFLRILQFLGYIALATFLHVYPFSSVSFRHSLDYTGELIEKKFCPLIFPEGQRTRSGKILPFKKGIGHLAIDTNVPIVPLNLKGTFQILPPGAASPKPGYVSVHIGKAHLFSYGEPEAVTEKLKEAVENL
ncbi:MAG: 1-acyl-sn-glycerol-3-phosphate acyltransferase, partial [Desulfobacterales bacterium]